MPKLRPFALTITLSLLLAAAVAAPLPAATQQDATQREEEIDKLLANATAIARRGDTDGAAGEIKKAVKLSNDKCGMCFSMLGRLYFENGKYKEAVEAYRSAIALKPLDEGDLLNVLGVCLYLQNDPKLLPEAADALRRSIELDKGKTAEAYYNLGHTLLKLGKEEEAKEAFKAYLKADPSSAYGREVRALIANPKLSNERFALSFKVTSTKGEELSLERFSGKIVLLDFWAVWCGPCRAQMPEVKRLWKKYSGDDFVMIGISLDHNRRTLDGYVASEGIDWPQYYKEDGENDLAELYRVRSIPYTVLIDENGIVRGAGLRPSSLDSKIAELLKKKKAG